MLLSGLCRRVGEDWCNSNYMNILIKSAIHPLNGATSVYAAGFLTQLILFVAVCLFVLPLLEGQYFSEEQMRTREPLLYEQYIGQYLTDEEVKFIFLELYVRFRFSIFQSVV